MKSDGSMTYAKAAELLLNWQSGRNTNFSSRLFELYAKADWENRERLRRAFPIRCQVFDDWQASENPRRFFEQFGWHVEASL